MALPGNITLITVTGDYRDFTGTAVLGQVKFFPSQVLIDAAADRIIIPRVITEDLVNGTFSVTIPVTDDADVSPLNYNYLYEESFEGGSSYLIQLPTSLGASVDISDLRATAPIFNFIQPIAFQLWPPLQARTDTQIAYYDQTTIPATELPIPGTYEYLSLYFDTYAQLASIWVTYTNAVLPELELTSTRINQLYGRMTRLNDFTATNTDLRETTNLGVVTRTGYNSVAAKWGIYSAVANQYATYAALTAASFQWTYAEGGNLITNIGNALTTQDPYNLTGLNDALLSITRQNTGTTYGALNLSGLTNAQAAGAFPTYAALAAGVFAQTLRDYADRLRTAANRPHPLLTRSYEYGINL